MSEIRVTNIIGETGTDAVNFTKGINVSSGVITATTFSGSGANLTSLPAGNLTGTLPAISGANLTGISAGEYSLAYANQYNHSVTITVNGSQHANGNLDGNRDCIVINNGNYHTVTPAHVDDKLVMSVSSNLASNWTSTGTYWGLGFMSATDTGFSANRNVFYLMGQHSHGNGAAGGDEYRQTTTGALQFDVSDIGLNVGTTYYIRPIGQVHSPNQNVSFNNASGTNTGARHNCYLHHYKKN